MRIAIPVTDGQVADHLGHCRTFLIVDAEGTQVQNRLEVPNPGHGPGGPPPMFLARSGVEQIVAWGMPDHAVHIFAQLGIKVILGATGAPEKVLHDFLHGTLTLTNEGLDAGNVCNHDH